MIIPIDRYRLIGVTIGAENRIILDQLERRLAKCKFSGFSHETMKRRREILEESTKILLDGSKRGSYDESLLKSADELKANKNGFEVSKEYEIAGILLLLEAGEEEECLAVSEQLYRKQRLNMSYFSSEYKELNRIIDYATLSFSDKLKGNRHYETAAEVLERRIRNHNVGMGEKEIVHDMSKELELLLPFRILDLLSRTNDDKRHLTGVSLLTEMVKNRGGLDEESSKYMDTREFYAFFRQIRSFLSVQQQIELYQEWSQDGSRSGLFLLSIALVAQGFAQRKPSRIYEALEALGKINANELEPIIGNVYLLLGDVKNAERVFSSSADDELRQWCTERSQSQLGALCEWCSEWLRRDVLQGYKDIDIEVDLDSYFADKDVVSYIESVEKDCVDTGKGYREDTQTEWIEGKRDNNNWQDCKRIWASNKYGSTKSLFTETYKKTQISINRSSGKIKETVKQNLVVFGIITLTACSLWLFTTIREPRSGSAELKGLDVSNGTKIPAAIEKKGKIELIRETIYKWHILKRKTLLENKVQEGGQLIATSSLLGQLEKERVGNVRKGQRQVINVTIENIRLEKESPTKVEALVELRYSDSTIDSAGNISAVTKQHKFQRLYRIVWEGGKWLVDK